MLLALIRFIPAFAGAGAWGGRGCLGSGAAEVFLAEHGQFAVGRGE